MDVAPPDLRAADARIATDHRLIAFSPLLRRAVWEAWAPASLAHVRFRDFCLAYGDVPDRVVLWLDHAGRVVGSFPVPEVPCSST